jgi:hypothetical protein
VINCVLKESNPYWVWFSVTFSKRDDTAQSRKMGVVSRELGFSLLRENLK